MILISLLFPAQAAPAIPSPPAPPKVDCTAADHRTLDFWLGDWDVFADGRLVARSKVERDADGCILRESFTAPDGKPSPLRGSSMTMRDARDGVWRQSSTDARGRVAMLVGSVTATDAAFVQTFGRERIRFLLTRQPDGSLRQEIETSNDFGKSFVAAATPLLIWRRHAAP